MKQKRKKRSTVWIKSLTNKCNPMLDPKQEMYKNKFPVWGSSIAMHIYIYIYSINFQWGDTASQCIYSIPKSPADNHIDRHKITKFPRMTELTDKRTDILYCHSGDLNMWPTAACSARNYNPRE